MPKPHQLSFMSGRTQKSCCKWLPLDTAKHRETGQHSREGNGTSCQITLEKKCVTTKAMFLNRKLFLVFWQALVSERSNLPSWMIQCTCKTDTLIGNLLGTRYFGVLTRHLPLNFGNFQIWILFTTVTLEKCYISLPWLFAYCLNCTKFTDGSYFHSFQRYRTDIIHTLANKFGSAVTKKEM